MMITCYPFLPRVYVCVCGRVRVCLFNSLAGQPIHKREEGSGVMPGVQPDQITQRHHQ